MARKVIDIIYNLVRKRLTLKGDGTGITSLPRSDQVERGMKNVFKRLKEGGYNVVSAEKFIKSEDDLARVLEEVNQKQIAEAAAKQKASEGLERILDKMDRGIPLNPSDQISLEGSGFKTTLDAFKGFEPKVIEGGKAKIEKSLQKLKDSRKPQKTLKDLLDEYDGDPDAMAGGGLAGVVKKLQKKFGKDIIQKGKAPKKSKKKELREAIEGFKERNMAGGGVAHMLGEPRENFADGGMSRRTFLKIMAALAAFPVVGKLAKTTKVAKGVKPIVTPTAEMPAHFPKLVEKIIREGQVVKKDFVKKTGDVTTYSHPDRPDIELTIEGEGNRIQLDFDTDQGMRGGYEFRKGDIIDEPTSRMRGKRGPDEFIEGEVKYKTSGDGYTKDFEEGIDTGTENLDEFAGVRKQKTSKSKINLDQDFAAGGLAGLLGE